MGTEEHRCRDEGGNWCWGVGSRSRRGEVAPLLSAHHCSGSASFGAALLLIPSPQGLRLTHKFLLSAWPHYTGTCFLFTLSSFILQFCSQTVRLKLIGKFIYKQSVSWLITTSQVFARVNHSSLSLLFCLQQCWFSLEKLWIKDPNNHVCIKYL